MLQALGPERVQEVLPKCTYLQEREALNYRKLSDLSQYVSVQSVRGREAALDWDLLNCQDQGIDLEGLKLYAS